MRQEQQFVVVTDTASKDFNQAIDIYHNSFIANERQTVDEVIHRIQQKLYIMTVLKINDMVTGFSLTYHFKAERYNLLDYLAVKKGLRNKGFGSLLFSHSYKQLTMLYPETKFLVIEVDDPEYGDSREKTIRVNRIKFYEKFGARIINNFKYYMPPMVNGSLPVDMRLMIYNDQQETKLDSTILKELLIALYRQCYNRKEDDVYLQKMLGDISQETITLGYYDTLNLAREE
ncbi:MAG: GNAT family N-acetyltransferase [Chloroflexi bacterium]|nr:GNAT family N-acetyltransferase [Chloroflexota bacterium]